MSASATTTFPLPEGNLVVLLLGAGGREHALAWKLAQSPRVAKVLVAPGNGGTELMGGKVENVSVAYGGGEGFGRVVELARERGVSLIVPGPELPLVEGCEVIFRKCELEIP
jgi:phosphoribosylamine--glycine ligase/phosphoribosylformylglycinamidine cyclo-ligase